MTFSELLQQAAVIYRDYELNVNGLTVDDEVEDFLERFLKQHFNDYLCILPTSCIDDSLIIDGTLQTLNVVPINFKGGKIVLSSLSDPYLKLLSFRHSDWKTTLFYEDLADENDPARKLQESKHTSGKFSRPFICIEHQRGEKCLCFWGYRHEENRGDIDEFSYVKQINGEEEFMVLKDHLLIPYIYYVLYFLCNSQRETELSQVMLQQMQQLLAAYNIIPQLPISFNNEKKK